MFMGEYRHTIDEKGRVIIPAKFREGFDKTIIVTRGLDKCLFLYPPYEWKVLEEKLLTLPLTKKDARAFTRFFFSGAHECLLDKQGRINLPDLLINYALLEKDCVIIGVSNRMEIWNTSNWNDYLASSAQFYSDIAENLTDFDL